MPAPLVVIKASLRSVSEIEQECLLKSAERAGAVKAIIVDVEASNEDVHRAIEASPLNFLWS
ncbi:hypothetical protein [Alteromonas gracilis]|uniref:hypothetical protein n=1 Tax=Alteromonas gracilis TaxID=1479524 RepID=UPI003736C3A9